MHRTDPSRTPTRREFLASGLAAAGLALAGRPGSASAAQVTSEYGPFKMGLQSYSLRHFKAAEALALTKELGLHYWESYSAHTSPDPKKAAEYKALAAASGVEIIGFGVSGFGKDDVANRRLFEFGKALGVGYLSADPTPDAFDSLDKLTEEYGIGIGIHPHGPGSRWDTIAKIDKAIKGHSDKIGICADTGHLLRSGQDPVEALKVFGKRVYGVHLKDVKGGKTFTVLGEGDLKLAEFLAELKKLNYGYGLALEYEENEKDPIPDIKRCLAAVRHSLG